MRQWLEMLKVRLLVNVTWRLSKTRLLTSLRLFAATEADSAWQLVYALERTAEPKLKAELFGQVLEEMHHAAEFSRLGRGLSDTLTAPVRYDRQPLYALAEDVWKFYAYCQIGEAAAAERFRNILSATREPAVRAVLKGILRDEAQHVESATAMLGGCDGIPEGQRRRELRRIKGRRLWEAWLRSGRQVADGLSVIILTVVYYVVGPLGHRAAKRRFAPHGAQKGGVNDQPVHTRAVVRVS